MNHKVPIVPLEIMGQHIELTRVFQCEGIQPFQKIAETMLAYEPNGTIVVFGFGHDDIGDVLVVGLHGFNVKKHVQGWYGVHVVHVDLLLLRVMGLQGVKPRGHPSFGTRPSTPLALAFAFLLAEFLRGGGSLNETTVGVAVDVLVAGRTIQVPALMTLKGLGAHFLVEVVTTATSTKAHGGLRAGGRFSRMVFGTIVFVTRVAKKVTMAVLATSCGFETSWISLQEIRAGFLATGPAKVFSFDASMRSLCVIGFPTVGTHVTGPEKPWQTGNDIVMAFLVEQDQLFVLGVSKRGDMEGTVGIHQHDLVVDDGRRRTEGRQGVVTTRPKGTRASCWSSRARVYIGVDMKVKGALRIIQGTTTTLLKELGLKGTLAFEAIQDLNAEVILLAVSQDLFFLRVGRVQA